LQKLAQGDRDHNTSTLRDISKEQKSKLQKEFMQDSKNSTTR